MISTVLLGAPSLALEHYRLLNVKQIQTDTLSYLILSRASTFALSSLGDLTYSTECMEASQIYLSNSTDVCSQKKPHATNLFTSFLDSGIRCSCFLRGEILTGRLLSPSARM
jgi:hypothetical protein